MRIWLSKIELKKLLTLRPVKNVKADAHQHPPAVLIRFGGAIQRVVGGVAAKALKLNPPAVIFRRAGEEGNVIGSGDDGDLVREKVKNFIELKLLQNFSPKLTESINTEGASPPSVMGRSKSFTSSVRMYRKPFSRQTEVAAASREEEDSSSRCAS